jgi:Skp family chaperone for outer membrane proteins
VVLRRKAWRGWAWICGLTVVLALCGPALAQEPAVSSPILVIDQNRLFVESAFGKASIARERAFLDALEDENKRIEAELVEEEQALTNLRGSLSAAEFSSRAEAFDRKVEQIRTEQDSKVEGLTEQRDADRKVFIQAVRPVVAELLAEQGAVAILEKSTIILSLSAIDVTDEAIAKVDAALVVESDGATVPPSP